jgi:conjugative transfer signal peptidase TraF
MRAVLIRFSCIVLTLWGLLWTFYQQGYRIVTTPSVPQGLWRVGPIKGPIVRGQFVWFCPPDMPVYRLAKERGYIPDGDCPGGYMHLMKPLAAVSTDLVTVEERGIAVNGKWLPNSKALNHDADGRPMPFIAYRKYLVEPGKVWLISPYHLKSFDSRYFGPVDARQLQGIGYPIVVNWRMVKWVG